MIEAEPTGDTEDTMVVDVKINLWKYFPSHPWGKQYQGCIHKSKTTMNQMDTDLCVCLFHFTHWKVELCKQDTHLNSAQDLINIGQALSFYVF